MFRRFFPALCAGAVAVALFHANAARAQYQLPGPALAPVGPPLGAPVTYQPLNRFFYYPYHYFPHNYWPSQSPRWPEPVGAKYQRPPAYMAYPPFLEEGWRYDLWEPHRHYRGFHFWLGGRCRDFEADANRLAARSYRIANEVPTVLVIAIVILAVVKPF